MTRTTDKLISSSARRFGPSANRHLVGLLAAALIAGAGLSASAGEAPAQSAQFQFADWMSVSGGAAGGTLNAGSISLSGSDVSSPPASTLDGSSTVFNRPDFSPPLPTSDAIHFLGSPGGSYALQLGAPVTDPVLHLGSLASTLEFPAGTQITRLSGDSQFSVSGSTVTGAVELPTDDANGSVRLTGTFTSIPFRATFQGSDGIFLQVGVAAPASPPAAPPPATPDTTITDPPRQSAVIWSTAPSFSFISSIPASGFECRVDGAAWASCTPPYRTAALGSGQHTFEVRAISPEGTVDPTPSQRRFSIGQSTRRQLSCDVRPARYWLITGWRQGLSDQMACQVGRQTSSGCPQYPAVHTATLCRYTSETCPRGARCTLTTDAQWYDADQRINWRAEAIAALGATSWGGAWQVPNMQRFCSTGPDRDRCFARASLDFIGDGRPVLVACVGGIEFRPGAGIPGGAYGPTPAVGPDSVRRLECSGDLKIDPAAPLETVASAVSAQVIAPGAGLLEIFGSARFKKLRRVSSAARARRPRIVPVRKRVSIEGPTTVRLKLNAPARRILKRRKKLAVSLRVTFTEAGARPLSKITRVTLTPRAKRPSCKNPRRPSSRPKRRPRPAPCKGA